MHIIKSFSSNVLLMILGIRINLLYKLKELVYKNQHFTDNKLHFNEIGIKQLYFPINFTEKTNPSIDFLSAI
ncbi:hypothetical protein T190423A01A_60117 [Tenacibaculum sp. 190130A14a]|uniref:Uncharacterized protein n=1 Tax=Tenacibaculum polynesiense TaxID=3137857 RepID=A0ABM9PEX7_9FLAO